ncbi:restriction endonuclease [bacterium]|nr:restriction endonuclease [bacterium]
MEFVERIQELATQVESRKVHSTTEEATKMGLIAPFIAALGYDVFNPLEVCPEFTADVGPKKGEKVDYAIMREGKPSILFECKSVGSDLDKLTPAQLARYFHVTEAKFAVFTDGVRYQFFSDLDDLNKMDHRPFLDFEITKLDGLTITELAKFHKDAFDEERIRSAAIELKYLRGIKRKLAEEWVNPSEEFVKLFTTAVYDGRLTQATKEQFTPLVKQALHSFISDHVNRRLNAALRSSDSSVSLVADSSDVTESANDPPEIETTEQEIEGFMIVKAICREVVAPARVVMRDTRSYCGVLLDDNNRKPICRLRFNSQTALGVSLFDSQKNETRYRIEHVDDLWGFAEQLKATCKAYDDPDSPIGTETDDDAEPVQSSEPIV